MTTDSISPALVLPAPPLTLLPVVGATASFAVRRIYCVGRNYLSHVRELQNKENEPPFFFQKQREMIVRDGGSVRYPGLTADFQHELELVVALQSGGSNIASGAALSHVYGYAVGLDMTRRDRQNDMKRMQKPWEVSKSFEDSAPCGAITQAAQCGHLSTAALQLTVNGQLRQHSNVDQLIWHVPQLIAALSEQVELAAGDLIYTGTPSGVGPVVRGDVLQAHIAGLAPLTVTIV